MKTSDNNDQGTLDGLNLSLGRNLNTPPGDSNSQSRPVSAKTMMTMMGFPANAHMARSLGVRPHSLVHKPSRGTGTTIVGRFNETHTRFVSPWEPHTMEEEMNLMWPGSFHLDPQLLPEQPLDNLKLDLNLRL
ncbi:hypothetical protein TEA_007734 [Camellia sinensis var. sinensis]|uniref:Uncharacterized protein n=1 Tax=Camellia sinensis var. sinensis TaxID=542762 RepID=A0A4S4CZX3_CAMSN|nr:hypothetical protein TEA_007734 [Camellia sinensis var. sinensis]